MAADADIAKHHLYLVRIEVHSRPSGGHQDSSPVRVCAEKSRLHERRFSDGPPNPHRIRIGFRTAHYDLHKLRRALSVARDLATEMAAHPLQRLAKEVERDRIDLTLALARGEQQDHV